MREEIKHIQQKARKACSLGTVEIEVEVAFESRGGDQLKQFTKTFFQKNKVRNFLVLIKTDMKRCTDDSFFFFMKEEILVCFPNRGPAASYADMSSYCRVK